MKRGRIIRWPSFPGIGRLFSWSNFSVGCCNSLSVCPFTREDFVYDCHTSTGARRHGFAALRATGSFDGTCSYAGLLCFVFETNQHFVVSARIVGLCFAIRWVPTISTFSNPVILNLPLSAIYSLFGVCKIAGDHCT